MKKSALVLIKPDAIQKGLTGAVIKAFDQTGLKIVAAKMVKVTEELANVHYQHLADKPFFPQIRQYITGQLHGVDRVLALIYRGENAIKILRDIAGATNPEEAAPLTIRGAYGRITTDGLIENLVHVSSDPDEAYREIKLWFSPSELLDEMINVNDIKEVQENIKVWK